MSGWLMTPERLPSYFARDSEPVPPVRGTARPNVSAWGNAIRSKLAAQLARKFSAAIDRQNNGSAAAW